LGQGGDAMEHSIAVLVAAVLTINTNGDIETFAALASLYLILYDMSTFLIKTMSELIHKNK